MYNKKLEGKVIIITGGTKGLGRDLALACAEESAHVIIVGRDEAAATKIINRVSTDTDGSIDFVYADLYKQEEYIKPFEHAEKKYGKIDGLVNYAGITPVESLIDATGDVFDRTIAMNLKAPLFMAKYAVTSMLKNGGGSIINVGSVHTWIGEKDRVAYACSKGGLYTLTNHIARHYAPNNIRCNYLVMGWVPTEGEISLRCSQGISEDELHKMADEFVPMGRMQETVDHIPGIIYLLSDDSKMVTASMLRVDGGQFI